MTRENMTFDIQVLLESVGFKINVEDTEHMIVYWNGAEVPGVTMTHPRLYELIAPDIAADIPVYTASDRDNNLMLTFELSDSRPGIRVYDPMFLHRAIQMMQAIYLYDDEAIEELAAS